MAIDPSVPNRFTADLKRAREYIDLARPRVHVRQEAFNLADELFGPYTCRRCCSYTHKDSDHGEQGVPLADRPEA